MRTSPTILASASFMSLSAAISCPVSSAEVTSICTLRSPPATRRAMLTASVIGRVMLRVAYQAANTASITAPSASTSISSRAPENSDISAFDSSSILPACRSTISVSSLT